MNTSQPIMNFSKWANIIKVLLLKIVEELERRINEKNGVSSSDQFSETLYTSLKFIILEQVDGMVDEAVGYAKKQINDLTLLLSEKVAVILASMVYVLLFIGLFFLGFIFFAIALSLYLGEILGQSYYGFLVTGGITVIMILILYFIGHKSVAEKIKVHLTRLM